MTHGWHDLAAALRIRRMLGRCRSVCDSPLHAGDHHQQWSWRRRCPYCEVGPEEGLAKDISSYAFQSATPSAECRRVRRAKAPVCETVSQVDIARNIG